MDHPSRARKLVRALWVVAIIIVVIGSLLPGDSLPMVELGLLPISDKLEHFAAYFVLAFLPALHESRRFIYPAALSAALLGVALEYGQLFSGWRDFEIGDMVADAGGVCCGLVLGLLVRRSKAVRSMFLTR